MTMLWQVLVRRTFLSLGIRAKLAASAITIYGGTQPTAADIVTNWDTTYRSSNTIFLAHYVSGTWTVADSSDTCSLTTVPAAVNASNTGTGAWAILWAGSNPALGAMDTTIPTTQFIVVPVTATGGSGVIQFADASFSSGVSKAIASGTILAGGL